MEVVRDGQPDADAGPDPEMVAQEAPGSSRPGEVAFGRKQDLANLKKIGSWHAAAVIAALTLFGAAHTWADASGWLLAQATAVAAAFLAGMVLGPLFHEWGHFAGARLSGALSPVLKTPYRLFFMFRFDMQANNLRQAQWLSWGGITGSWLLVVLLLILVPMDGWASAVLLATAIGQAVNASVFEVPVVLRTRQSGEFERELTERLKSPGVRRTPGLIAGVIVLAALT